MVPRSVDRFAVLALFVAGCSITLAPAPSPVPTANATAPATTVVTELAPTASPEPSLDPNGLPPTTVTGWWGDPDQPHECARPGSYRIGYRVAGLGDCNGMFNEGPPMVTLDVGEDFDLHMTIPADGALPIWPLPEAEDLLIADGWLITDNATMTYRGLTTGTTRLVTRGACYRGSAADIPVPAVDGTCPVLVINVRAIDTTCVELPDDLCRAAGAAAVRIDSGQPGQRIVGWVAEPASLKIEWPGCGHVVAKVTLDLREPDGTSEITLGQPEPETHPLALAWCTY